MFDRIWLKFIVWLKFVVSWAEFWYVDIFLGRLIIIIKLTHWGRMTHICVSKQTNIGSDNGLSPWLAPSHYLNQCWNIVNWTLRNKLQWNPNWNSCTFIQENALEDVVWKMAAILPRPQCVKTMVTRSYLIMGITILVRWCFYIETTS